MRLEYLDGLRAVAALYVVLFHAGLGFLDADRPLHGFARNLQRLFSLGHDAVAVFIVLGLLFDAAGGARRGNAGARRAEITLAVVLGDILPPYFAALFGSLLLIALAPVLETPTKTIWADSFPRSSSGRS
ncbi:MAG: hypothetical protein WDO74_15780 [Pseudomonadota bacterium]